MAAVCPHHVERAFPGPLQLDQDILPIRTEASGYAISSADQQKRTASTLVSYIQALGATIINRVDDGISQRQRG